MRVADEDFLVGLFERKILIGSHLTNILIFNYLLLGYLVTERQDGQIFQIATKYSRDKLVLAPRPLQTNPPIYNVKFRLDRVDTRIAVAKK